MRNILFIPMLLATVARAQDCSIPFTEPLFGVQVESDIWYGNATRFNGGTDSLRLNLYKPVGDGQTDRPLVVLIHGGGLIEGHRNDFNALCDQLASYGYAAATISYRLGYYGNGILEAPYAYDPNEFRRAAYRAMQDAKGAIRFLKGRSALDSTSTTSVILLGASAGAITAMHAAYLDQPGEKPASCSTIGQVQHFFNFFPRPDLGGVEGDLNLNGHSASVLGAVNLFGAVLDTAFIGSTQDPALFSYHQTGDPVVGCSMQQPYWGIGLGMPDQQPWLQGSCTIDLRMQHLGFSADRYHFHLHTGNEHTVHDPVAVLAEAASWMRDLFCFPTSITAVDSFDAFSIHPNPAHGVAWITMPLGTAGELELLDPLGRLVSSTSLTARLTELDLRSLASGTYLARLRHHGGARTFRLVLD
ncbi:MAG: carboxylesterase family protein [Flavobacteriales bacterium]|jgi:dienelactone hydrolase|nr:carboxylesterase family protein [Flavobacteriales bacterium]